MIDTTNDFPGCGPSYNFGGLFVAPVGFSVHRNAIYGKVWLDGETVSCVACKPGIEGWIFDGKEFRWGNVTCEVEPWAEWQTFPSPQLLDLESEYATINYPWSDR